MTCADEVRYGAPNTIDRLRARALGPKRSLVLREFALGIEGLQTIRPLRQVHECVVGLLALESEPVHSRV